MARVAQKVQEGIGAEQKNETRIGARHVTRIWKASESDFANAI
jgi:hypothetical protein